jgi:hypothetical protein
VSKRISSKSPVRFGSAKAVCGAGLRAVVIAFSLASFSVTASANGFAVGLQCFREAGLAADAACRSYNGLAGTGVHSCDYVAELEVGEGASMATLVVAENVTGQRFKVRYYLGICDIVDLTEYADVIAAWFLGLVTVLATRSLYTRVFRQGA